MAAKLNLNSLLLFSENPKKLAAFYQKILGAKPGWTGGDFAGYKAGDGYLIIGPHDKVHGKSTNPERMMFNLETRDVKKEFERIKKLGAKVVQQPYHPDEDSDPKSLVAAFADPDNNFFQIMSPMI